MVVSLEAMRGFDREKRRLHVPFVYRTITVLMIGYVAALFPALSLT